MFRQEDSWPPPIGDPNEKQIGLVVALDVQTGKHTPIHGMGRHNHENSVAIPGFDDLVVMSGDDTFTNGPLTGVRSRPGSMRPPSRSCTRTSHRTRTRSWPTTASSGRSCRTPPAGFDDYYDFVPGSNQVVTGHFIQVPKNIATGLDTDGSGAQGCGRRVPAAADERQLAARQPHDDPDRPRRAAVGARYWSDINNVFQFVRVEDIAYDKRSGMGNVVYIVDSRPRDCGRDRTRRLDERTRLANGLDPDDPTVGPAARARRGRRQPGQDARRGAPARQRRVDRDRPPSHRGPGSGQQFPFGSTDPNATTARLWSVPFSGAPQVVVKVDQSADGGPTDVDGRAPGNLGAWESSGIVDASAAFGPGAFLIDVQAATLWVERAPGDDNNGDGQPDFTYKRAGGQLLLLRIPT